jgi:hypothetical protein
MKSISQTTIIADRFYTIASKSGSVIEAVAPDATGTDLRLGEYKHQPTQEWSFIRAGDDVYRIQNRATGKMIDLMMSGTVNGTWLHQWQDDVCSTQLWIIAPTNEGTVKLRSQWANGKCIDTVGMGTEVGSILQIWQEVEGADQIWTINEVKETAKRTADKKPAAKEAAAPVEPTVESAPAVETAVIEPVEAAPAPVEAVPVVAKAVPAAKKATKKRTAAPAKKRKTK